MKSFFITGTDTDCGKTYAVCALHRYFVQQQKKVMALKPLASGCFLQNGQLFNADELQLQALNAGTAPVSFQKFEIPVSPHLAAQEVNQRIDLEELKAFCEAVPIDELDYLFVEGAGGLMVPLNDDETWIDFLHLTNMPVIIVVGMRLGCINHALLTTSVASHQHIPCAGWIANCLDPNMLMLEENIQTLQHKMEIPLLGRVGFNGVFETISCL